MLDRPVMNQLVCYVFFYTFLMLERKWTVWTLWPESLSHWRKIHYMTNREFKRGPRVTSLSRTVHHFVIIYSRWERRVEPRLCHQIPETGTGTDRSVSPAAIATIFLPSHHHHKAATMLNHKSIQLVINSAELCWKHCLWQPQVSHFSSLPSCLYPISQ